MSVLGGSQKRARGRIRQQRTAFPIGPFIGTKIITEPFKGCERYFTSSTNYVRRNTGDTYTQELRPGFAQFGIQLGTGGGRKGQCIYQHTRPDQTDDAFLFCGGKMYAWDGVVTLTDITPGAVTISATARIYCTSFAGLLIVSDGVNRPWTYNPATATATYIDIDGSGTAWNAYGQPEVYGGKLFFIMNTKGGTSYREYFTWSEEAAPATGYQQTAAGFSNFWEFSQTSPEPLIRLVGTNSGLFIFRQNSISIVTGAVSPAFQTSSTHDAVSSTHGAVSPAAVLMVDRWIYFYDRMARLHRFEIGGPVEEIWRTRGGTSQVLDVTGGASDFAATFSETSYLAWHPDYNAIVAEPGANNATPQPSGSFHVWDVTDGQYLSKWELAAMQQMDCAGVLKDADDRPTFMTIGAIDGTYSTSHQGYVWLQEPPSLAAFLDNGSGFTYEAVANFVGYSALVETTFDELVLETSGERSVGASPTIGAQIDTSQHGVVTLPAQTMTGTLAGPIVFRWGFAVTGRYAKIRVYGTTTFLGAENVGLYRMTLIGCPVDTSPRNP